MTLLQMSLAGGVMAAAVIAVRALTLRRLPKGFFLLLWYVVLSRLLVPFSLPCRWSVYTLLERIFSPAAPPEEAVSAPVTVSAGTFQPLPAEYTAPAAAPELPSVSVTPAVNAAAPAYSIDPWLLVWLAGALCCAVFFAAAYIRCRRHFAQSLPVTDSPALRWLDCHRLVRRLALRQSDHVRAPLTYGLLRPVILLPRGFDWDSEEEAGFALEHEFVHVRRFDALTKLLLTAAVCLHWFNPLVWCAYILANRDIELACDEAVLRRFGHGARQAYAMALIHMAESGLGPAPLHSAFGKNAVEERITAIMKIKKTTAGALICAVCLLVGVTTVFATSAAASAGARPLTETEIARANKAFSPIVTVPDENGGYTGYASDVSCFFTSFYDDPRELNFKEFLRQFPSDETLTNADAEEFTALSALPDFNFDGFVQPLTPETMPVPVHRIRAENINAALEKWAGITLEDIADKSGVCYLEEYGAYYTFTSDFGPGVFDCAGGEVDGDTARLWTEPDRAGARRVLTLERSGGKWLIRSHQQDTSAAVGTAGSADTVLSYTDAEGQTWYSTDGGKTFLSEADFRAAYPETEVEWWTYEEYAEWLENEKVELQSMLGEKGWTGSRGEFVWTQELIDESIAMYEDILAQIGWGVKVSKTVDGSEDTMLMQSPYDQMLGTGESTPAAADFLEYEPLGLKWDEAEKALFYNGKRVRYFLDGAEVDDFGGMAVRLEYADRELAGKLDLRAVRERVYNADGSYDPMGPLLRLEKCPEGMFDERVSSSPALAATAADIYTRQVTAESNAETEKLLKKYAPFGLSWEFDGETGAVSMSWNGKTVHSVFDSVEQLWIANNMRGSDLPAGAADLEAVYKNGRLTGLRELQEQTGAVTAVAEGTGEPGGKTFAEIFEKYEREYVIDYVPSENGGRGNLYHLANTAGQPDRYLISHFADVKPDGSVFTFDSDETGGLSVQTVYGEDGELVWHVVTVTASPVAAPALTSGDKFVRVHGLLYEGYGSSGYVREADLSPDAGLIAMYDMYGSVTGCFDAAGYDYDDHAREPKCRIINGMMCCPAAGHDIGGYGSYRHGYISEDREGMYGAPTDDIDKMAEYLIAHPEYGREHDIPLYDESGSVIGGFTIGPGNISLPEGVDTIEGAKEYLRNLYQ